VFNSALYSVLTGSNLVQQCSSLANSDAVINALDAFGRTPLHYCMLYEGHAIASVLVKRGAAKCIVDSRGATPLDIAIGRGRLADEHFFLLLADTTN
jgi:ankyrin repeat protein